MIAVRRIARVETLAPAFLRERMTELNPPYQRGNLTSQRPCTG
jgi:hypothetical protein